MSVFSGIFLLIFVVQAIVDYLLFGEQLEEFHSVGEAIIACFMQIFGVFNYTRMYNADKDVAVYNFTFSTLTFCFLGINMYTAIVLRSYNKLRERKMKLGEAMGELVRVRAEENVQLWVNLISCASKRRKNRDNAEEAGEQGAGAAANI